ncbi:MAG: hypothetical protein ABSE82_14380 [Nitrososphaerales archaeon]|jgi:hypothetical protein
MSGSSRGFSTGWIGIGVFLIILGGAAVPLGMFVMTNATTAGYQFSTVAAPAGQLGCDGNICVVGFSSGNPISFPLAFVTSINLIFLLLTGALEIIGIVTILVGGLKLGISHAVGDTG